MSENNQKLSLLGKRKECLLKENFSFVCFIIALIIIAVFLTSGITFSIRHHMMWYEINEFIENIFLCSLLVIIIISTKKKKYKIVESLIGELLAIYLVATTCYFAKTIEYIIEEHKNGGDYVVASDYIFLVIEFILMLSCIFVFFDHLFEKGKENKHINKKIPIRILAILDSISLIFYIFAMLSYGGFAYIEVCLEEFLYALFGTAISYAILSIEMRKIFLNNEE